jgi:hypothetical protein
MQVQQMTIHYHGTPITPVSVLHELSGHFFCVSHWRPDDVERCHRIGQGVMLDNGAFSAWMANKPITDWAPFYAWAEEWLAYPTSWAVIPDVIAGTDADNDALIAQWPHGTRGAPVWHMHEPIDRLKALCDAWPRVCIGSSAEYAEVGADNWHARMNEAMNAICKTGRVPTWLHMLRGMAAAQWGYPFASVDSTDIARNHNRGIPAAKMAERWDAMQCSPYWAPVALQQDLLGEAA